MEDLYTYLGYILIAILLYLIGKTILAKRLSLSLSKEGFMGLFKEDEKNKQEKNDTISELKTHVKYLQDDTTKSIEQLNLSKNRKLWEELIIAMEDRINCASLQSVASVASMIKADPENEKLLSILGNLNELNKYKDTLRDNMKYLDGLK
jgi:hypothetical protein